MLAQFVRKHQVIGVIPHGTCSPPILCLLLLLCTEIFECDGGGLYRPGFTVLGSIGYVIGAAVGLVLLELLADGNFALLEIHLFPGQPSAFALPQSCEQAEGISVAQGRIVDRGQEPGNVLVRQGSDFKPFDFGRFGTFGGVGRDECLFLCHVECVRKGRVTPARGTVGIPP